MSKSKGKMTFTAEFSGNVIMDNNNSYSGFHMVQHEPVKANKMFKVIHTNAHSGFADCFPPAVAGTKHVLAHHVSGTTLATWINSNQSSLVYLDNNGIPIQMTDMLRLIIQDLGLIVLHGISTGIKLFLEKNNIYISNDEPYRVLAVAESIIQDDGKKTWVDLRSLLNQIWIDCQLVNNDEAKRITRTLTTNLAMGSIEKFLYSPVFWMKETRIYSIIKLGEMVDCAKNVVARNKEHSIVLQNWRAKFRNDPNLSTLVTLAPQGSNASDEIDCLIKFLSDTFSHFSRMCKRTTFRNKVKMMEYYDNYYPDMMDALYESQLRLHNFFRRNSTT